MGMGVVVEYADRSGEPQCVPLEPPYFSNWRVLADKVGDQHIGSRFLGLRGAIMLLVREISKYPLTRQPSQIYLISMKLEKAAKQLEALGNPTRLKVYRALVRAGQAGLPVGRLQKRIGIAASTLSHHLHRLILTELVTQQRQATTLICRANYPAMDALLGFLADECCADAAAVTADRDSAG